MSKPQMRHFMGNPVDQKEKQVTVTYDPSAIRPKKKSINHLNSADEHPGKIGNDMSNMSLAMSLGKDERIFKMTVAYDKGEVISISSVAKLLDVSYATAKKYGKEANIKLFDDKSKKYTDGRLPKNIN